LHSNRKKRTKGEKEKAHQPRGPRASSPASAARSPACSLPRAPGPIPPLLLLGLLGSPSRAPLPSAHLAQACPSPNPGRVGIPAPAATMVLRSSSPTVALTSSPPLPPCSRRGSPPGARPSAAAQARGLDAARQRAVALGQPVRAPPGTWRGLARRDGSPGSQARSACAASPPAARSRQPAWLARGGLHGAASPPATRSQQQLATMAWPACPSRWLAVSLPGLFPARQLAGLPARRRAASHPRLASVARLGRSVASTWRDPRHSGQGTVGSARGVAVQALRGLAAGQCGMRSPAR
jgi:hypothetical protein